MSGVPPLTGLPPPPTIFAQNTFSRISSLVIDCMMWCILTLASVRQSLRLVRSFILQGVLLPFFSVVV